jgi:hypothetical protein
VVIQRERERIGVAASTIIGSPLHHRSGIQMAQERRHNKDGVWLTQQSSGGSSVPAIGRSEFFIHISPGSIGRNGDHRMNTNYREYSM